MQLRRRLRRLQRDLRSAHGHLAETERPALDLAARTDLLVDEARAAGLISTDAEGDARSLLVGASEARSFSPGSAEGLTDSIADLNRRRDNLNDSLGELRANRRVLVEHRQLVESFDDEAQEQRRRLSSLGLLATDNGDGHSCPLCGSREGEEIAQIDDLRTELRRASDRAARSAASAPQLEGAIEDLDGQIASLRTQLGNLDHELGLALKASRIPTEAKEEREQRAFVRGRIASFLEEHPALDEQEVAALGERIESLEAEIEELEAGLSREATRSRTDIALSYVSDDITKMAQRLGLSFSADGVRLDPFDLTVIARNRRGPVRLDQHGMGSGRTWVGYHVVTLLALHRYFIDQKRPVPRMLLLDQPTQAFYPSEAQSLANRNLEDMTDEDQQRVHRIFELIRDTVNSLNGALQVIVLDHAEIPEQWFIEAVGDNNWRRGQALVPSEWF